jgi:phosphatidate cytidylyltransferase
MLKERLIVVIILLPLALLLVTAAGWFFAIPITAFLAVAAWEYWRIFTKGGYSPSLVLLIGGVVLLGLARAAFGFQYTDLLISILTAVTLVWFVFAFERGENQAAVDFGVTLGGILYLGWLGSYLISLHSLPDGVYWLMLTIPAVAFADAGAYAIGRPFGKHKMSPRVSPKKSWEGYFGGILFSIVLNSGLAALWHMRVPGITWQDGLILALVMSVLGPLGDLGESMFKRQFGVKDSSNLLPGHGGIMDRIDTWIWAAVICYYLITNLNLMI